VNPVSGKCLVEPRFNTADGTQLEIYTCNGGFNQQWKLPERAGGYTKVVTIRRPAACANPGSAHLR
jgi:hypothetical protein